MMYPVSSPEICGSFDVERAQLIAQKSADQAYPDGGEIHWYNRPHASLDAGALALHDIDLSLLPGTPSPDHGTLYAHNPVSRPLGRRWHIDNKDLLLGYTSTPTQFVKFAHDELDISPIAERYSKGLQKMYAQRADGNHVMVINKMDMLGYCVEQALQKGDAHIMDPIESGTVVRLRPNTIHRSFTPNNTQPHARLFIALDLNP